MGKYYLFKLNINGDMTEKEYRQISNIDLEYIMYEKFLINHYANDIEENEDYIVYVNEQTAIMILSEELFEENDLENVFEILYDSLYKNRGGEYEENINYKWVSNFR